MRVIRHHLFPVSVVFIVFGLFIGSLAVSIADIEHMLDISHAAVGALLAIALLFGVCCSALVSVRAHKRGVAMTMRECALIWSVLAVLATFAPSNWILMVLFVAFMGAASSVDVVMNTMATAAVHGKPGGLMRVHAMYCLGAAIGAVSGGVLVDQGYDFRYIWLVGAVLLAASTALQWNQYDAGSNPPSEEGEVPLYAAITSVLRGGLVIVVVAFVLGAIVEGGIDAWGPLYLRTSLDSGAASGAVATAAGYTIGFTSRMSLSVLSDRIGAKRCALVGAAMASCGLMILVSANSVILAAAGLALAVGGITANWPLLISYSTQNNPNAALITGGLSTAGYAGLVIGPAVLGSIASAFSLRSSLVILAGAATVAFALISSLPRVHRPRTSQ